MPNPDKLELFIKSIIDDAMDESKKILDDIRQEREDTMTAAEDEYLSETFRYIKNEVARIGTETGRKISKKVLENKRALYARREEISAEVIGEVSDRIDKLTHSPEYLQHMTRLLLKALEVSTPDLPVEVLLREEDMHLGEALAAAAPGWNLEFTRGPFELGGMIVSFPTRHLSVNESFDDQLEDIRAHMSELLGLGLGSGESEESDPTPA